MTISASSTTTTISAGSWNGPICSTCGTCYLGYHTCTQSDIIRRIGELTDLLGRTARQAEDPTLGCPCRPENGGSGVCGCVLSGPRIT